MVGSAAMAYAFPFELFLFVYAVLGPLHYFTQISWLHDRGYYTKRKYDFLFLLAAAVIVTCGFLFSEFFVLGCIGGPSGGDAAFYTFLAFMGALFFALLKNIPLRLAALVMVGGIGYLFGSSQPFDSIFGMFLPTLIHTFIFTGLFILAGTLKGKSFSGLLSLFVFVAVGASFLFFHPAHAGYEVSDYVRNSFGFLDDHGVIQGPFYSMSYSIIQDFHLHDFGKPFGTPAAFVKTINDYLYRDPKALALMSFIAFGYTYHYLNWFSKTSIIGWHEIPRARGVAILLLWAASLGLYAYDYSIGLNWLFFLSFAHVLLEFPLDHLTAIGIGRELKERLTERSAPA